MNPMLLLLLVTPPFLWGSNAIVGQLASGNIPPITLNVLRWLVALAIILPFALGPIKAHLTLARSQWKFLLLSGFMGITCFNSLQYQALTTSSAINVSLIGASTPIFVLLAGRAFFGYRIHRMSAMGAVISLAGVACILTRGEFARLNGISFVPGDLLMLAAAGAWSIYTLLLKQPRMPLPPLALMALQIIAGLAISVPIVAAEQLSGTYAPIVWGWKEIAIVMYVGTMPSLVAYFCWQRAVARTSAQLPVFFMNLTPLFTVGMATVMLGERPQSFHSVGLLLILSGIFLAQQGVRRSTVAQ